MKPWFIALLQLFIMHWTCLYVTSNKSYHRAFLLADFFSIPRDPSSPNLISNHKNFDLFDHFRRAFSKMSNFDEQNLSQICFMAIYSANQTTSNYEKLMTGWIMAITVGLGILGNILSVIILTRSRMKTSINVYFLALAFWDTNLLIASFICYSAGTLLYGYQPMTGKILSIIP